MRCDLGAKLRGRRILLTVGVVEGDEVKVVVVQEGCCVAIAGLVAVDELVGKVFDHFVWSASLSRVWLDSHNVPIVEIHY